MDLLPVICSGCHTLTRSSRIWASCHGHMVEEDLIKCRKAWCEKCADEHATYLAVDWINDGGLPCSFCKECAEITIKTENLGKPV